MNANEEPHREFCINDAWTDVAIMTSCVCVHFKIHRFFDLRGAEKTRQKKEKQNVRYDIK